MYQVKLQLQNQDIGANKPPKISLFLVWMCLDQEARPGVLRHVTLVCLTNKKSLRLLFCFVCFFKFFSNLIVKLVQLFNYVWMYPDQQARPWGALTCNGGKRRQFIAHQRGYKLHHMAKNTTACFAL